MRTARCSPHDGASRDASALNRDLDAYRRHRRVTRRVHGSQGPERAAAQRLVQRLERQLRRAAVRSSPRTPASAISCRPARAVCILGARGDSRGGRAHQRRLRAPFAGGSRCCARMVRLPRRAGRHARSPRRPPRDAVGWQTPDLSGGPCAHARLALADHAAGADSWRSWRRSRRAFGVAATAGIRQPVSSWSLTRARLRGSVSRACSPPTRRSPSRSSSWTTRPATVQEYLRSRGGTDECESICLRPTPALPKRRIVASRCRDVVFLNNDTIPDGRMAGPAGRAPRR